jgi:hypothetical protein
MSNDTAKSMTRTQHSHWCRSAHKSTVKGHAPTAQCLTEAGAISCSTETLTVRSVRRQKNRLGMVKVTWSNGGSTWETDTNA